MIQCVHRDNGGVSRLIQVSTFVSFSLERHKTLLITCCLFYHLFDQCENGDTVNMILVETLGDVLIWIFCHFVICLVVSACSSPSHSGAGQTARMPVIKLLSLRLTEWRQKGGNRQRGHRGDTGGTQGTQGTVWRQGFRGSSWASIVCLTMRKPLH